jgi:AcrR family transcriptional regulator
MGIAERREREKEQMRQNILAKAMKLFVEDGYTNVSIRKIAEQIEYSPATIYLYFRDKDEILYHLHEEAFRSFLTTLEPVMAIERPDKRLAKLAEAYLQFALENPERYELMFIMKAPMKRQETWECGLNSFNLLRQTVQECIEQNLIRGSDPEAASLALWAQVHGLASLVVCGRLEVMNPNDISHLITSTLDFFEKNLFE